MRLGLAALLLALVLAGCSGDDEAGTNTAGTDDGRRDGYRDGRRDRRA